MRATLLVLCLAVLVAGCGRRGSPNLPESAELVPRAPIDPTEPEGATAPDRPFVLDKLLQ